MSTEGGFERASARIGFNLATLAGTRLLSLVLTLVQMGIIFRALDVEGRGQFGFSLQFASLFTVAATLGIQRLLVRDIARDPAIAWDLAWTACTAVAVLSGLVFAMITGLAFIIEETPPARAAIMLAAVWTVVLWAWQQPFEAMLLARERMGLVSIANAAGAVLKLGAVWVLMARFPTSAAAHGAIALATGAAFLLCAGFAVRVYGWQAPHLRPRRALAQVRECFPFAAAMLFSQVYFKSDMSLLKFFSGDLAAGVYTPPQRVIEPLLMMASLWGTAVFPALCRFSHAAPDDYLLLKRTSLRMVLLAAFPMAAGLALLADPVIALLTGGAEDALGSVPVLRLLALLAPFFYLNSVAQEFFYSAHRNWLVAGAYAAGAAVSVALNCLAIPRFGPLGAAGVALAVNALISAWFIYALRAELGGMRLPTLTLKTLAACAAMGAVVILAGRLHWSLAIAAGSAAYLAAQAVLRTLNVQERALIGGMGRAVMAAAMRRGG
jgi:O-antigen/teichoic acid export membrane protein